ncbi:hypothetical protein D3C72_1728750 [compost metagenome]
MGSFRDGIQRRLPGFGLFALSDVTRHGDTQLVDLGPTRRPQNVHDLAILAHVAVFEVELGLAAHDLPCSVEGALTVGRVHQIDHRQADHLIGAVTENTLAGCTDKDEAALLIHRANGVQQEIDVARQRRRISGCHGTESASGQCSNQIHP